MSIQSPKEYPKTQQMICVVGSLNTDLVARIERFPLAGETICASGFDTFFGGKGGNQAVAAARLGAPVHMIGMLGDDSYGTGYLENLRHHGIGTDGVGREEGISSGIALISVTTSGENQIIISPGANGRFDVAQLEAAHSIILKCDILLLQLEIPIETVLEAAAFAHRNHIRVILDPAPAQALPDELFPLVEILTPNQGELALITGLPTDTPQALTTAGRSLIARGVRNVIVKAGANGAYLITPENAEHCPPVPVDAIDTVGAGDCFNGALAASLSAGSTLEEAVSFANAAAAISTTVRGAQSGMPDRIQVGNLVQPLTGR